MYINPKAKDLKEILHVVDTPLNKLVERDLCPGKEKINQIKAIEQIGLDIRKKVILFLGGSQGSLSINNHIIIILISFNATKKRFTAKTLK